MREKGPHNNQAELVWVDDNVIYCMTTEMEEGTDEMDMPEHAGAVAMLLSFVGVPWMFYKGGYCSHNNAEKMQERFGNAQEWLKRKKAEMQNMTTNI